MISMGLACRDAAHPSDAYAFAYSDAIGLDGTLHSPNAALLPPVTIALGDARTLTLGGALVPRIAELGKVDDKEYDVKLMFPESLITIKNKAGPDCAHLQLMSKVRSPLEFLVGDKSVAGDPIAVKIRLTPFTVEANSRNREGIIQIGLNSAAVPPFMEIHFPGEFKP